MVAPKPDVPLGRLTDSDKFAVVAEASRKGYDAVDMTSWGGNEIRIVNPDSLNIPSKDVKFKASQPVVLAEAVLTNFTSKGAQPLVLVAVKLATDMVKGYMSLLIKTVLVGTLKAVLLMSIVLMAQS